MRVYLIVNKETDAVAGTRVFASAELAWAALDAQASWIAGQEAIRKMFDVVPVEVESTLPGIGDL